MRERISANTRENERLEQLALRATEEAQRAKDQAKTAESEATQLRTLHSALAAAVPLNDVEPLSIVLPVEFEPFTTRSIADFHCGQGWARATQVLPHTWWCPKVDDR